MGKKRTKSPKIRIAFKQIVLVTASAVIILAVGYILGSGITKQSGEHNSREHDLLNANKAQAQAEDNARNLEKFLAVSAPGSAQLKGKKVAVFTTAEANNDSISGIISQLKAAGATVTTEIRLADSAFTPDESEKTTSIVNHALPPGATINKDYVDSGLRFGSELSWLTLAPAAAAPAKPDAGTAPAPEPAKPEAGPTASPSPSASPSASPAPAKPDAPAPSSPSPAPSPSASPVPASSAPAKPEPAKPSAAPQPIKPIYTTSGTITPQAIAQGVKALEETHLITVVDGTPAGDADYAIIVTHNAKSPQGSGLILAALASGLADRGQGVVLVNPDDSDNSPVASVRALPNYRARLSTVDNGDSILGQSIAVYALHFGRSVGSYGTGKNADSLFPTKP